MEKRVGFGKRLFAFVIDFIIICALYWVLWTTVMLGNLVLANIVGFTLPIVWMIWEGLTGQTLGKLLLGIRIKNEEGTAASIKELVTRALLKYGFYLLLTVGFVLQTTTFGAKTAYPHLLTMGSSVLMLIGYIWGAIIFIGFFATFQESKKALHDFKTAVYSK